MFRSFAGIAELKSGRSGILSDMLQLVGFRDKLKFVGHFVSADDFNQTLHMIDRTMRELVYSRD